MCDVTELKRVSISHESPECLSINVYVSSISNKDWSKIIFIQLNLLVLGLHFAFPCSPATCDTRRLIEFSHKGFQMSCQKLAWSAHGLLMVCSWSAHGLLMVCSWSAHGLLMVCSWSAHGLLNRAFLSNYKR